MKGPSPRPWPTWAAGQMLRRAPLADPVVFRIVGYEVALRRTEARCILVSSGQ